MSFGLKKMLSAFFLPLPFGLFCLLVGLFLLWTREAKWARNTGFIAGFLIIFTFSLSPVANFLLDGLQSQYKPLLRIPSPLTRVVVLGGGVSGGKNYPANLTLGPSSLSRLVEGIRLFKLIQASNPRAELILSGGRAFQSVAVAGTMRNTAVMLGVNPQNIILEDGSQDTRDEAVFLQKTLQDEPFILVTSAYHMPRSMGLFEKLGMHPIAAPTQFFGYSENPFTHYLPNTSNLMISDIAIHEYLGILFEKSKGYMN